MNTILYTVKFIAQALNVPLDKINCTDVLSCLMEARLVSAEGSEGQRCVGPDEQLSEVVLGKERPNGSM